MCLRVSSLIWQQRTALLMPLGQESVHAHRHLHACRHSQTHTCIHTGTHACMHTHTHTHTHTHRCTHTHSLTETHTHTHTHTHTFHAIAIHMILIHSYMVFSPLFSPLCAFQTLTHNRGGRQQVDGLSPESEHPQSHYTHRSSEQVNVLGGREERGGVGA